MQDSKEEAAFAEALQDVRGWLDLKMRTGRYALGFAAELAGRMVARHYSVHTVYDEIGILEGASTLRSTTKPATPFKRPPLVGLWHKHHHQARFIPKNLLQELHRPGVIEAACAPHIGRNVEEVAGSIAYELVIGAYTRRAAESRVTGEFIVYEPQPDGANLYRPLATTAMTPPLAAASMPIRRSTWSSARPRHGEQLWKGLDPL